MDTARPAHNAKGKRRSTRVAHAVFLTVTGIDGDGQPFVEETGTLELSLHGCRYFSKYEVPKNSGVVLEIPNQQAGSHPHRFRGRVAWVRKSRKLSRLFQVGVELEAPGNVWALSNPPEDWQQPSVLRESDVHVLERELKELLALAEKGTYYELLRVTSNSPRSQIKRNYYELARRFHPDRHMARLEWTQPLHKLMDTITQAYKILTDETARKKYDERLAESGTFTLGRQKSDLQKTADECLEKARECLRAQNYGGSILWLRKAVHIEPESSKYHALLARSLSAVPQYRREAIEHFQQALELDPLNTTAHLQLAALYEEMKLPWRARAHYQKILEILPEDKKARERLHLLDAAAGKRDAGKRTFIDRLFSDSAE
jgi:tetratricopeptide (TPR) repeat protein